MTEFILSPLFCYLCGVAVGAFCQKIAPLEEMAKSIKFLWKHYQERP